MPQAVSGGLDRVRRVRCTKSRQEAAHIATGLNDDGDRRRAIHAGYRVQVRQDYRERGEALVDFCGEARQCLVEEVNRPLAPTTSVATLDNLMQVLHVPEGRVSDTRRHVPWVVRLTRAGGEPLAFSRRREVAVADSVRPTRCNYRGPGMVRSARGRHFVAEVDAEQALRAVAGFIGRLHVVPPAAQIVEPRLRLLPAGSGQRLLAVKPMQR